MSNKPRTDAFQRTCIRFENGEEAARIQKAAFTLGFRWVHDRPDWNRTPIVLDGYGGYIYISKDYEMSWSSDWSATFPVRTIDNIEHTAVEFKAWRKVASKATKKRGAARKWDATATKRTLDVCPVRENVVVAVKRADGEIYTKHAGWFDWKTTGHGSDIVSYKVLIPNRHKPPGSGKAPEKVVTQDEMFDAIAKDMGLEVITLSYKLDTSGNVVAEGNFIKEAPDTNPKRQYGLASIPLNMWSPLASAYGALGLYNGSLKYGKANFANTPVEASIYIAAAMRHLSAWAAGQEDDPADGVPNLGGVLANIAILLEARAAGMLIDDRLLMSGYLKELDMLKGKVKHLQLVHEGKNPKHYTVSGS